MDTHYSLGGSNSLDDDQLNEDMGDHARQCSIATFSCQSSQYCSGYDRLASSSCDRAKQAQVLGLRTMLENAYYIGKDCELRGGWPLELVARGVVQDVDPNTEYGERTLEEGNFKVYVQVVCRADVILPFPHNAWQRMLGQVVRSCHLA
ncbi:hypothetical protein IFM89_014207 [Coptis chinensis]|uniref:Uncharacterized protein n=1 Tax=Coptis chinensis TaxID=261450 RepID=A0A835IY73_9MAGN|nr:hypothetical protein IFM89_014207 [Coptis chinensis]